MRYFIGLLLAFFCAAPSVALVQWPGVDLITQKAATYSLGPQQRATVLIFLSAHCPCSIGHEPQIRDLSKQFSDFLFLGIHSNDGEGDAHRHFSESALGIPVLDDSGGALARRYKALKTPHAFVIARNGDVIYSGGVDDSHFTERAKAFYLRDALGAVRSGAAPTQPQTRTVGCRIEPKKRG